MRHEASGEEVYAAQMYVLNYSVEFPFIRIELN